MEHVLIHLIGVCHQNVIIVMSCQSDTRCHQRLCHRDNTVHLKVGQLDRLEKSDVAREMLSVHRKQLDESPFNNQVALAYCFVFIP